jgi:hypothetical protein
MGRCFGWGEGVATIEILIEYVETGNCPSLINETHNCASLRNPKIIKRSDG